MNRDRLIPRCAVFALLIAATMMLVAGCSENPDNTADTGGADTSPQDTMATDTETDGTTDTKSPDVGSINCGDETCAADEYCVKEACCGADVGFNDAGEWRGSNTYSCEPVPQGCNPNKPCDCQSFQPCSGSGICTQDRRVTCPAA